MRLVIAAVVLVACGKVNPNTQPDAQECPNACDDGDQCTVDTCTASGCTHDAPHGSMMVAFSGAMTTFTVPTCVAELKIEAWGAAGGDSAAFTGGAGAYATGTAHVAVGNVLTVLAGGRGQAATDTMEQGGGTGGGGTFVVDAAMQPLVVAGGGGGAWKHDEGGMHLSSHNGIDGQATNDGAAGAGTASGIGGAAGTNGDGGGTPSWTGWHTATGGGGFKTAGLASSDGTYGTPNTPGQGFLMGGAGGLPGSGDGAIVARPGGFGGGGCAGMTGAGGGGYSGGGAGAYTGSDPDLLISGWGGGGGSFTSGAAQMMLAGMNPGADGRVVFSW